MRILTALLLAGCSEVHAPDYGWQPLHGTEYRTPYYGLYFWWTGPGGGLWTPEEAGADIDRVYEKWLAFYDEKWGDKEHWELLFAIYDQKIQLFTGDAVPGNTNDPDVRTLGIWWWMHDQIDTSMNCPYHYDEWLGIYTQGLEQLMHEWSHVVRGYAHD